MEHTRALRFAGRYFAFTTALSLIGLAAIAVGAWISATGLSLGAGSIYGVPVPQITSQAYVGIVPIVLGVAIWRLGKAWAMYTTLTDAVKADLADTYDTEHVKSDIVAVLDDRLSDMQQDLQSVNRELREVKQGTDGFEFGEE